MKYVLAILLLCMAGCSFRMWDAPTYTAEAPAISQEPVRMAQK